jgi:hypothetical protein
MPTLDYHRPPSRRPNPFFCALHPFLWLAIAIVLIWAGFWISSRRGGPSWIIIPATLGCFALGTASTLFGFLAALHLQNAAFTRRDVALFIGGFLNFIFLIIVAFWLFLSLVSILGD